MAIRTAEVDAYSQAVVFDRGISGRELRISFQEVAIASQLQREHLQKLMPAVIPDPEAPAKHRRIGELAAILRVQFMGTVAHAALDELLILAHAGAAGLGRLP